jgi:amino acid transporter
VSDPTTASPAGSPKAPQPTIQAKQLTWFLAWAVVFCDIGTSVYYVPGILYEQVGELAPVFVAAVMVCFVLLSMKYVEICWRNPEGGGVVTVAGKAFGPRWGALGGMLITVDYFLTSAISATSAFYYVGSLFPFFETHVVLFACLGIAALAGLNIIGIRESAAVALFMALAAVGIDVWVIGQAFAVLGWRSLDMARETVALAGHLDLRHALVGYSAAWLAFSGLESIAQLAPAMREPVARTARRAMTAVIVTILLSAPMLTLLSVGLLHGRDIGTERFISELGAAVGGTTLKLAVVFTATSLLLFAANTAIIGGYHIFLALGNEGFLPRIVLRRNRAFGTPHVGILITTVVPMVVIIAARGRMVLLGDMYAFGLLGCFVLSSLGVDYIHWRLHRRGPQLWIGLVTSALVVLAFAVNLFAKPLATAFGGGVTAVGMLVAIGMREGWWTEALYAVGYVDRRADRIAAEAERRAGEGDMQIVNLAQAEELKPLYPSHTLVAVRGRTINVVREAITRVKGRGESALYCLVVDEVPGLFLSNRPPEPNGEGLTSLRWAFEEARRKGIELIPIWMVSYNAADAIARAADTLDVDGVIVGVSRRNALYRLLRGHVVRGLASRLPKNCHLILCN